MNASTNKTMKNSFLQKFYVYDLYYFTPQQQISFVLLVNIQIMNILICVISYVIDEI